MPQLQKLILIGYVYNVFIIKLKCILESHK